MATAEARGSMVKSNSALWIDTYSVVPKYQFVLRGKGIVERVAGTFSDEAEGISNFCYST